MACGGLLVTLHRDHTAKVLQLKLKELGVERAWMGLRKEGGRARWITGEQVTYAPNSLDWTGAPSGSVAVMTNRQHTWEILSPSDAAKPLPYICVWYGKPGDMEQANR